MSDPITNGNAANIPPPDVTNPGSYSSWQLLWQGILNHIDALLHAGKPGEALQYTSTSLLPCLNNYNEQHKMVQEADVENVLSTLGQYRNAIEEDFDSYSTSTISTGNPTDAASDALYAETKISDLLNTYGGMLSEVSGDITNDLQGILDYAANNAFPTAQTLADYWAGLWRDTSVSSSTTSTSSSGGQGITPVTDPLTDFSNTVSSQDQIVQSMLKMFSADESQYEGMLHTIMQSIIDLIKAMVSAMQTAGN